MIGDDEWNTVKAVQLPTQLANRRCGLQQCLRREPAECENDARVHQFELAQQVGLAGVDFCRHGIAISRRTMLEHVADVDLLALQLDRTKNFGQQLPRFPNERAPLLVFVCTRRFTHAQ